MRERLVNCFLRIMESLTLMELVIICLVTQIGLLIKAPYILAMIWLGSFIWLISSVTVVECDRS